jgi:micrococcal nuclease
MRFITFALLFLFLVSCSLPSTGKVVDVVDGDTIVVKLANDRLETVRLIGIDTPETVDPRRPIGCFGPEASVRMHQLAEGAAVRLEAKPDEERDKYGRLLRYVFINEKDVGGLLITEGFARSYNRFPHSRMEKYKALEHEAKVAGLGLWSVCVRQKKAQR